MGDHPSEADYDRGGGHRPSRRFRIREYRGVAEVHTASDESNPLPEFVQTGGGKAAKPADAELPSIV